MKNKALNVTFIFTFILMLVPFMNVNALEKLGNATNFQVDENGTWSFDPIENATYYEILLYEEGGTYTGGNFGGSKVYSCDFSNYTAYNKGYYIEVSATAEGYESSKTTSPVFTSKLKKLIKPSNLHWVGKTAKFSNNEINEDYIKINLYHKTSNDTATLVESKNLEPGTTSYNFESAIEDGKTYYFEAANIKEGFISSAFEKSKDLKNNLTKLEIESINQIEGLGIIIEKNNKAASYSFQIYREDGTYTGLNYGGSINYWLYSSASLKAGLEDEQRYYVVGKVIGDGYNNDDSDTITSETFTYHKPNYYQNGDYYISIGGIQINDINKDRIVEQIKLLGNTVSGEVTYDPENKILTLNNFNLETKGYYYGTEYHAIVFDDRNPVTINVEGNNSIRLTESNGSAIYNWFGKIIFTGSGTLNVIADEGTAYRGSITIDGPTINFESYYRGYDNGLAVGNLELLKGEVVLKSNNNSYEIIKTGTIIKMPNDYCILLGDTLDTLKYENLEGTFTSNDLSSKYKTYAKITKKQKITKDYFDIKSNLTYDKTSKNEIIKPKNELNEDDYSVNYYKDSSLETEINEEDIIEAGTYYVKVTGKNYYTDSFVESIEVDRQQTKIELNQKSFTYNGQIQKPIITVKDLNGDIIDEDLYTVNISESKNSGTYKVTVQFDKNYKSSTESYTINKKSISSVSLSTSTYTYNGYVKTPSITVKAGTLLAASKITKSNSNVTVSYQSGRKYVGTYKITITGKGNYTGTKTITFKIIPPKTSITSLKASKKAFTVKYSKKTTQTTGYQIQYSTSSNFKTNTATKSVSSNKTYTKTVTGLKSNKKYYVRVRTYKLVGKTKYYSSWTTVKSIRVK